MLEKQALYFAAGAREFWLCDEDGRIGFFTPRGRIEQSALFPAMPAAVQVDA